MGKIMFCQRWKEEDSELSSLEVTKRILAGTMSGLESYLDFTMETEDDFSDKWLPTLDTKLKVSTKNIIMYQFFEKPTNPNTVLHQRTAMAEDSKVRSLTNEVIRRMVTTGEMTSDEERCKILDEFAQKLYNSGYKLIQIRRIILAGIKRYEKMKRMARNGGRRLHRTAGESSSRRASKKLTEKSEWFRKEENNEDPSEWQSRQEKEAEHLLDDWLTVQKAGNQKPDRSIPTRSVLFVENTRGGKLAKQLREIEQRVCKLVGFKTKIVEGVGSKLKHLLPNTNPWSGAPCGRECIPCGQEGEKKQDCRKRNIIYESKCLLCNPEQDKFQKDGKDLKDGGLFPSIYVGETGRSLHERAKEHWRDFTARKEDSHILKHWVNHHQSKDQPKFRIDVIRYCRDALSRQVGEYVRVGYRGQTLNSKGGFNRSGITRLVLEDQTVVDEIPEQNQIEDCQEPRGLGHEGWKTGEKRKNSIQIVNQPKQRKRRKLVFETLPEDWGEIGVDIGRMENEE
jgi:hypothetical protein